VFLKYFVSDKFERTLLGLEVPDSDGVILGTRGDLLPGRGNLKERRYLKFTYWD